MQGRALPGARAELLEPPAPGAEAAATPFASLPHETDSARADYLADGIYRWQDASQAIVICCIAGGSQPGYDGPEAVQAAIANWNGGGGSVHYTYGGNDPTANHGLAGAGSGASDGKKKFSSAAAAGSAAVTLAVVATGTSLHYQWYEGATATDRSHPVGTNSSTFTMPTVSSHSSFFVVVSNGCGTVSSRVAGVSVRRRHGAKH